jgi:hypothetical protein
MCAYARTAMASITFVALVLAPLTAAQDAQQSTAAPRPRNDERNVRNFRLQYVDAGSAASTIENLFKAASMGRDGAGAEAASAGPAVACDSNTNSIIASGSKKQLDAIEKLVAQLDGAAQSLRSPRGGATKLTAQSAESKPRVPPQPQQPPPQPDAAARDDTPVRVDITVFEVSVPAEKSVLLEAEMLESNAATPAGLLGALSEIGPTRLLYRIDRTMTFVRPVEAQIEANVPCATGQISGGGPRQRTYSRESVGAEFKLSGEWIEGANRAKARFQLLGHLSGVGPSGDTINVDEPLHEMRHIKEGFDGVIELGKPAITLSLDGAAGERPIGTAYVVRVLLSAP